MIIDCISDLHGFYPKLEGGDLLIVAGDLTATDNEDEYYKFNSWICELDYNKKIVIAGNHDNLLQQNWFEYLEGPPAFEYLCDSGTEFSYHVEGFPEEDEAFLPSGKRTLKIWGSPWTKTFPGMNPKCKAFTVDTEEELAEKWELIPEDTDILITHSPSWGLHDANIKHERCGSKSLTHWIANHVDALKLFVCGHIHEAYGIYDVRSIQDSLNSPRSTVHINCSHVNERYEPFNKLLRVIL